MRFPGPATRLSRFIGSVRALERAGQQMLPFRLETKMIFSQKFVLDAPWHQLNDFFQDLAW